MCLNGECRAKSFSYYRAKERRKCQEWSQEKNIIYATTGCGGGQIKRISSKLMGLIKTNLVLMLDLASSTTTFFIKHKCPIKTTVQSQL